MFELMDGYSETAVIKVVGIGGGGGNAVAHMVRSGIEGVDFICANTDAQALKSAKVKTGLQIGCNITKGLGAGANPEVGRQAAMEDRDRIQEVIEGADMLFITAGLGGGTGTGAAPVVAQLAKEMGILTVAVVTKPFGMEGGKRMRVAEQGIAELGRFVDSLITIPNEKLLSVLGPQTTLLDAFKAANEVLQGAVQGIAELITRPGLINVDFADVRTVMDSMGRALMGVGCAKGEGRARLAAEQAITSPLLDDISVDGATGVLINIVGGPDLKMKEIEEAATLIQEQAHEDANIIFGAVVDPKMQGKVKITVIATGFDRTSTEKQAIASAAVTPVDLHSYTAWQSTEKVAASGGGAPRLTMTRRPVLEMPAAVAAADPSYETFSPGAEFEPVSPLDVPAFLRRQNE
jgi:cell division protein FtsZ